MTILLILQLCRKRHFSTPSKKDRIYGSIFEVMKRRLSIESTREINLKLPLVEAKETPSKGDTVQIKANVPRRSWKIGKIIELLPNSEGKVRAAKVLLATKSTVN